MYHKSARIVADSQVGECLVPEAPDMNENETQFESAGGVAPVDDDGGSEIESDNPITSATAATSSTADVVIISGFILYFSSAYSISILFCNHKSCIISFGTNIANILFKNVLGISVSFLHNRM